MKQEDFLASKGGATLEQLEEAKECGVCELSFSDALDDMEIEDASEALLDQLRFAYDMGIDEAEEANYAAAVKEKLDLEAKKKQDLDDSERLTNPFELSIGCMAHQAKKGDVTLDRTITKENLQEAVQKLIGGDKSDMLTILMSQTMQLQLISNMTTTFAQKKTTPKEWEQLTNMQVKVMAETRKNVIAMDGIANPKKLTYVKTANQHNYVQNDSENNLAITNEISQGKEDAYKYTITERATTSKDNEV